VNLVIAILLLGVLASVSPSTLVVFILLLATTRARVNAAAFLIGWSVSLVVVFSASYAIGGSEALRHGDGGTALEILEILAGGALLALAQRGWTHRDRPRTGSGLTKTLTGRLKELKPWQAAVVGVLEQPWTLTAAAAIVVVRDHSTLVIVVIAFVAFTVLSTATVGVIFVYYANRPGEAEARLDELRDRLVAAGPAIFAVVCAAVGVYLVVDGALGLAGG
jgi:Sap, sulfolipid-1-addressing protein